MGVPIIRGRMVAAASAAAVRGARGEMNVARAVDATAIGVDIAW